MWWLDPGKDVLNIVFNRILAPYVENLDMNQVKYGIAAGSVELNNLRLKKGALDKFRLPVDVSEGFLGKFVLKLHWMNLGNEPVQIKIEDVFLLVTPSGQTKVDPQEEEERAQASKQERLENAELLHMGGQAESTDDSPQTQGLIQSLIAKVLNNLQIEVNRVHIRYEDRYSVPGHLFAAGITLSEFKTRSVNEKWEPAFVGSTAGVIHKLATLHSLAVYFDTDCESVAGRSPSEFSKIFKNMINEITNGTQPAGRKHQLILKPVSGEGRITMNHKVTKDTPRFDVQLLFDEIGVVVDKHQYMNVISVIDMYHVYMRQQQYRKYKPLQESFSVNAANARLRYAATAILEGVRERRRQWTWAYFAERRDDRNKYIDLFERKVLNTLTPEGTDALNALERKLSYEDLRFYRSIARSRLRKDAALRKRLEAEKQKSQPQAQGWSSWLWGSGKQKTDQQEDSLFDGPKNDEERQQLYDMLEYDEKAAVVESIQVPRESLKLRVNASLNKGSFALKVDPHGAPRDIVSVVFESFRANVIQRPDNFEATVSLGDFSVHDGTSTDTLYPKIVQVQRTQTNGNGKSQGERQDEPFFWLKFENNPLDERADSALDVRLRHMEIVYHTRYVEAIYKFLKPPESQLESVEALLNVASETFEGLRKETRAGLEYALQTHKTIDIQMDMNAPIIIVPEDITNPKCKHLLIDAGHIAIESELADKQAIQTIYKKRKKQYNDEDYKQLEELMYDKYSLKLEAAQFLLGDDLQSCRDALLSEKTDTLHLLERTNIDFQVQNSIVPTALSLARFKVSGKLPSLQVNFSDTKYKALMRLVDVAIPKFDDGETSPAAPPMPARQKSGAGFPLSPGFFGPVEKEYHFEETEDEDETEDNSKEQEDEEFFEADDGGSNRAELHQHIFEFNFQVGTLGASISKSTGNGKGPERLLGSVSLDRFNLAFALAKFDMRVDVNLRSLSMDLVRSGADPLKFISSTGSSTSDDKDILNVVYTRVQKESPEFDSVYEGINQNVDVKLSTFIFMAPPEEIIMLYDFIMTTFVPQSNPPQNAISAGEGGGETVVQQPAQKNQNDKIRVLVQLASVEVCIMQDYKSLATLSLSTADVSLLLRANTMRLNGRLGNLAVSNDSEENKLLPQFQQILSIEGQDFAEFKYETFDPSNESYAGVKSAVFLRAGSIKFNFLEEPLRGLYLYLAKLAKLKVLYDAATQVAVQKASEIERMEFDVAIKTPIAVFPTDPARSEDVLVMRLGEITAKNTSETTVNKIGASLHGIQLVSQLYHDDDLSILKMIDDIDVSAEVTQTSGIDRDEDTEYPDTQASVRISDVKLHLTQIQYGLLIALSQSVTRVLAGAQETSDKVNLLESPVSAGTPAAPRTPAESAVDLQPELHLAKNARNWTTIDLVVAVNAVRLHLYDAKATTTANLKDHGIAKFALRENTLRFKMLSDGAGEAQIVLKSFTVSNTQAGNTQFREIIPAARHDRNQFMLLYTMAGGKNASSLAVLTVDSPQVIFAVDPIFSLLDFIMSAFPAQPAAAIEEVPAQDVTQTSASNASQSVLDFRIDLHDVSVSVLEDDTKQNSQCIKLTIQQILLSKQGIVALNINKLGMSLARMGSDSESVRFLDDVDMTFSLDSRSTSSQQMMSIEISSRPIVLRASYRDIMVITSITNKAIAMYGDSQQTNQAQAADQLSPPSLYRGPSSQGQLTKSDQSGPHPIGKAKVITSKEQLTGSFDGFRLILIGDLHEQPMLHLSMKPFILGAKDWSGDLQASTTIAMQISFWNLTNSHWEPLIDPWTFTASVNKETSPECLRVGLSSRDKLDLNLSATFAELALTTWSMWGREGDRVLERARGSYAPYQIRNRTGNPVSVWHSRTVPPKARNEPDPGRRNSIRINNSQSIDWRFGDWQSMREHEASSEDNYLGIGFESRWRDLRVPVNKEGEFVFALDRNSPHRLLCEVTVEDTVKIITLRSTYKVENQTLYPLEVAMVDDKGHAVSTPEKISPGQDYYLPIEAISENKIRIQPDQGFGYKWCSAFHWRDLVAKKNFTIRCQHGDRQEADFRFQASVQADTSDLQSGKCPRLALKLRAPIELENLLPFNISYRIYDKDANQNWKSYLRQGGIMPVHSVELGHLVLLNIELQDTVFKPSDFAIVNTDSNTDFDIENRLTVRDPQNRTLELKLNYIRYPDSGGAFKVQVYSPYLVINKTGLPFAVRSVRSGRPGGQDVAGETQPDALSKPTPFMMTHHVNKGSDFAFRFGNSAWSKPLSFEAPAAETVMTIASQRAETHVGVTWSEGLGKYKLTKVVTITPRFLIKNDLGEPIAFRERSVGDMVTVRPGQRHPLHTLRGAQEKLLTFKFGGLENDDWSSPINIEDIGSVHLRLKDRRQSSHQERLIRADIKLDGSTIFINLCDASGEYPLEIENESDFAFTVSQTDKRALEEDDRRVKSDTGTVVQPHGRLPFAWIHPAVPDKRILMSINGSARGIDIMEIGDLMPWTFKDPESKSARHVSLDIRADGRKQILRITNYNPVLSVYKPTRRETINRGTANEERFQVESTPEDTTPGLTFQLDLAGIGISLVNKKLVEVIYMTIGNLAISYTDSPKTQEVHLSCGILQLDNQLHDAIYPVILQPTPLGKQANNVADLPTVQATATWLKDQAHGVLFIKYFSVLLQALTIEADEDLLFAIYDLVQIKGASWESGVADVLIASPGEIPEPQDETGGTELYFEVLELQPIQLSLSFMRTERVNSDEKLVLKNPLAVVLNALTMAVGNINDARLEMNALGIKDFRGSSGDLLNKMMLHYRQEVLRQLYRILGSADFIGNPVGLFTNVSSGVAAIFYEPFNGVVMHGNRELGIGIAKGAASFVKKTVFGVSDSFTKFTSSVGKGLSAATFDSEYQAQRRMTQRRNKPRHAIYGVAAGGEALASSVASAMEGVVLKPLEGAETDGARGFFKGVGKGLVGAFTKPVVGVFDLASNVSEGIRNTTTVFDNPERDRARLPRLVPADGVLQPYLAREALGQYWMRDLDNGAYRKEFYVAHINIHGSDKVVLLTMSRVLSFWSNRLKLDWDLRFTQVTRVTVEDTGIRFAHKAGKEHEKFIHIPDKSSSNAFYKEICNVVTRLNLQRKME
ncbi:hypothetical protein HGRIS_007919 [Hohenbuehelia grisea]|uniref:Vacuolar protein sorting-associated protein 13 n=1 Tax=Hohenbuehelia grisea TaxID=104357 RepID=A0ABR3J733_9AGAR